jgi:hypothetical protein
MATTKIWPVKDSLKRLVDYASNPDKTTDDDLAAVIKYAMNGDKTAGVNEKACYVTGVNCIAETALEEMLSVQNHFGKTGGNVAYHCYQSFKPGEVTPEQCHRLGVELARRMWGDKYQVLVATHLDRDHLHNHLVCCSVSFIDGKKFNDNKGAYARFRRLSDEICIENGLSVIEKPKGKTPRQLHFAEKNGEPTKYNLMREAIDKAISLSIDTRSFLRIMKQQGYIIDYSSSRKYPTIRSFDSKKAVRMYHLGSEYELDRIAERIWENDTDVVSRNRAEFHTLYRFPKKHSVRVKGTRSSMKKISGIYGLYLHYLYLLGYRPEKKHRPLSPEMREACRWCDKYSESVRLMAREHIRSTEDIQRYIETSDHKKSELIGCRNKVINRLRREKNPERISELKAERTRLTGEISEIRKSIRTAEFTLDRSEKVRNDIKIELSYCQGNIHRSQKRDSKSRGVDR